LRDWRTRWCIRRANIDHEEYEAAFVGYLKIQLVPVYESYRVVSHQLCHGHYAMSFGRSVIVELSAFLIAFVRIAC
jgi:hypothetical protein